MLVRSFLRFFVFLPVVPSCFSFCFGLLVYVGGIAHCSVQSLLLNANVCSINLQLIGTGLTRRSTCRGTRQMFDMLKQRTFAEGRQVNFIASCDSTSMLPKNGGKTQVAK